MLFAAPPIARALRTSDTRGASRRSRGGRAATEPLPFVLDGRQWHVTAGATPMLVLSFADLWMHACGGGG